MDGDVNGQEFGEGCCEFFDDVFAEEVLVVVSWVEGDSGAVGGGLRGGVIKFGDGKGAVETAHPFDGWWGGRLFTCGDVGASCGCVTPRARDDADVVRDHEAGQQADSKLSEVVVAPEPEFGVTFGGASNGGEKFCGFGGGQADSVVVEEEGFTVAGRGDGDLRVGDGGGVVGGADGVDSVLDEFAEVDAWA